VRFYSFSGQAWAEGKGELAMSRHAWTADKKRTVHIFARIMTKQKTTSRNTDIMLRAANANTSVPFSAETFDAFQP